jgi:nitric oxide reductase activation protein
MDLSSDARDQSLDADAKTPATEEAEAERTGEGEGDEEGEEEEGGGAVQAAYLYDEWNGLQNEYYRDWCKLREVRPEPRDGGDGEDEAFRRRVEHVKKLFQRLRPDVVVKEKYLESGDYIDIDSLVRFVTLRKAKVSPQVRFWMKPRLNRRDVGVALLVDCSGSTGRESGRRDVLGVEKQAARILATGLGELGDRFGIFGFTGNGREQCTYQVFKDFDEDWDRQATDRLMAVRPGSSTRIGVALRHTGQKLARRSARTRLIILLTDGRPMDTDYDPQTRYAHYDVRKACEENNSLGIDTFCIAIDIESREELDLMFPRRRYVVLDDAGDLPDALTRSYLKLTRA